MDEILGLDDFKEPPQHSFYFLERERVHVGWEERPREREREKENLSRLHTQLRAQLRVLSHDPEIMT